MSSPFYIFVDIFRIDGTRATLQDTNMIRALDEEQGTLTFLGQCDVTTVGRQQVFFTHAPHQYPGGRLLPNVQLQLFSSSNLIVHTTKIYEGLRLGSTIKVILGEDDSLLGIWIVNGSVTDAESGAAITAGEVQVLLVSGSDKISVGTAPVNGTGNYTLTIEEQFVPVPLPPPPTFIARYKDTAGVVRAQSAPTTATGQEIVINLSVQPDDTNPDPDPDGYIVRGTLRNTVGVTVPNVLIEACQLTWGSLGMQITALGRIMTDAQGKYAIGYSPAATGSGDCGPPSGEVNLLVRVLDGDVTTPGAEITRSEVVAPARKEELIDLMVDRSTDESDSEYLQVERQLRKCLSSNDSEFKQVLYGIRDRNGYLGFASKSTGVEPAALLAFAQAYLIADEINRTIQFGQGALPYSAFAPLPGEIVFALTRSGLGGLLKDVLRVDPSDFLKVLLEGIKRGAIDSVYEPRLSLDADGSLPKQWSLVRAYYLGNPSAPDIFKTDESRLLALVLPEAKRLTVAERQSEFRGDFAEFVGELKADATLTALEAENLLFVFEFFATAGRHFPIVDRVFGRKAARGWKTAADLATVTRRAENGVDGWEELALLQVGQGGFPEDIFGRTDEEKATAHARRLYEAFHVEYPQGQFIGDFATFADDAAPEDAPALQEVAQFLKDNPEFNLEATNIARFLRENEMVLSDGALDRLKQVQRLRRLTTDFTEAKVLIEAEYDSAIKIARVDEPRFIAQIEQALNGDIVKAQVIHRKAKRYASEVLANVVRFHEHLNNTGGAAALFGLESVEEAIEEAVGDEPRFARYATLFGDLFSCASKQCQTVLSPAAYLVDLLQFTSGAPKNLLLDRRPDLAEIELNCENTDKVLPYIDLVIETLSAVAAPWEVRLLELDTTEPPQVTYIFTPTDLDNAAAGADADKRERILAVVGKNFRVTEQATLRSLKPGTEWVIEDESVRWRIYESSDAGVYAAHGAPQTSKKAELLEVFPEHQNPLAEEKLSDAVFPFNLPLALGRREVDLILQQRGLTRSDVLAAFPENLDPSNPVAPDAHELVADADKARIFLSLTVSEEAALLSGAKPIHEYWGFSGDETETIPRPESPHIVATASWLRLLSEVSIFLHRSGLRYAELLDLLATEFIHPQGSAVYIDTGDEATSEENARECNYNRYRVVGLDEHVLRRISFFLRLWRKLGWDMHTLDRYLVGLDGTQVEGWRAPPPDLIRLARVIQMGQWLGLKPVETFSFYGSLDLRPSERLGASLFQRALLTGPRSSFGYQLLARIAAGASETAVSNEEELDSLQATVRTALKLQRADFVTLWDAVVPAAAFPFSPTVEQLSELVRVATFCRALRLSVADYFLCKTILGINDPFAGASIDAKLASLAVAVTELQALRDSALPLALVDYLLRHPAGHSLLPTAQVIDDVRRKLSAAAQSIEQRYPAFDEPNEEALETLLGEVMPLEKIPQVLAAVAGSGPDEDKELLKRYFEAFLGAEVVTYIDSSLFVGTTPEQRIAKVALDLRAFLVRRERGVQALAVAAEVSGLQATTVDYLLSQALSSTTASGAKARSDWEAGIGAFEVNFEEFLPVLVAGGGTWGSNWVSPINGDVRFVLELVADVDPAATDVTVLVNGQLVPSSSPLPVDGKRVVTFGPIAVRAGDVRTIEVQVDSGFSARPEARLRFAGRIDNNDAAQLPTSWFSSFDALAYLKLQKAALLVTAARLDTVELNALHVDGLLDDLPITDEPNNDVAWSELGGYLAQLAAHRRIRLQDTSLFEVVSAVTLGASDVARLTGWDVKDVIAAFSAFWSPAPPSPSSLLQKVETWKVLERAISTAQKLDIGLARAVELMRAEPTSAVARALRELLRAKYTTDAFVAAFKPGRDALRQAHRDALVGYLTSRSQTVGGEARFFINENDLFGYFLIDVEMEPDTQISRIRLALNSIQLFVLRVFLGLEDRAALDRLDNKKEQWQWMQNYRVWEANRKVFLYPENWIEPQLRDDKSELFKQLEDALRQDDVDDASAHRILARYVDGLDQLAQLVVVGLHATTRQTYIVARDRARPYAYYHRVLRRGGRSALGHFEPWTKIPLEIDSDFVAPVEVGGKLRIFWPLVQEKEKIANGESSLIPTVILRLMWSTLDATMGEWSKPRLGKAIVLDRSPKTVFQREAEENGPETTPYHLSATADGDGHVTVVVYKASNGVPQRLGSVVVTSQGEDFAQDGLLSLEWGDLRPEHSKLQNNAAYQEVSQGDRFTLGADEYFKYVPGSEPYRVVVCDAEYFPTPNTDPIHFEAGPVHLMGAVRKSRPRVGFSGSVIREMQFESVGYPVMKQITQILRERGPDAMMSRSTQALPASKSRTVYTYRTVGANAYQTGMTYRSSYLSYGGLLLGYYRAGDGMAWGITQRDFSLDFGPNAQTVRRNYPLPTVEFDYGTAFGVYNWELFFHLPVLIADRLSQEMRFDEALKWLHYVFDPRRDLDSYELTRPFSDTLPAGARFWNFLPFFANPEVKDSLLDVLGVNDEVKDPNREQALQSAISDWRENPFSPHLIARQRIAAYQKFTVMKYLDTLVAWGDELFRRDTIESINQATQLYVLAAELLGERPEVVEAVGEEPRASFKDLAARGIDDFSNALVELEALAVGGSLLAADQALPESHPGTDALSSVAFSSLYFRIPRNEKLESYWDTVADRLFKIRNSLNIDGVKRQLALFEPPIDPALLVRARAAGIDLSSAISQLSRPLPHYRFSVWVGQAKELANELKSFSSALLSALEKKDAEELSLIRQDHEVRLLTKVTEVRKTQLREAEQNLGALQTRRALPLDRIEDLSSREFINASEETNMSLTQTAGSLDLAAGVMNTIAGALGAIPQVSVGAFSASAEFGGQHLNSIFTALGTAISTASGVVRTDASLAGILGGFERRQEDWDLQIRQARLELKQIDAEIIAAEIRVELAKKELENQELQVAQSEEIQTFLKDKFTSRELYQWMITQLSRTYQQVYKLAFDVAKTAERTFAFELGVEPQNFIQFEYRDSLRQGLLAGEKLFLDLKRMEVTYLERDRREFEITKAVSLESIHPAALQALRQTGECFFDLPEVLFDLDFPGQYFRRIQAVRLTIPAVTGPYTSVSAKLSLLGSAIRAKSVADQDGYAYRGFDDPRFVHDTRAIQSIATSRAQDDAGLFELNFRDERYLPFEGAGAVSRWRLELPKAARQFDYSSISDVVMNVSYTARDGGGTLKTGAETAIEDGLKALAEIVSGTRGLVRVISMKREFPDALHQLLSAGTASLTLERRHFPYVLRTYALSQADANGMVGVQVEAKGAVSNAKIRLVVNDETTPTETAALSGSEGQFIVGSIQRQAGDTLLVGGEERWTIGRTNLSIDNVEDVLFTITYTIA